MRIVQLAAYSGPYSGSFVPMLRAAVQTAVRRGWDPRVVLSRDVAEKGYSWVQELAELSVPITFLAGSDRQLAASVAELIAPGGPTILHTHFTGFDVGAVLAGIRHPDVSTLWHIHSPQKSGLAVRARNVIKYGLVGRGTFRILCVAPDIAADVRHRGAPSNKVEFFPNAIDTQRFRPADPAVRAQARRALGLPADDPVLLHYGWDWHRKGGDLFLEMLAELQSDPSPILGVTAGGGDPARALVARLGLEDVARVVEPVSDVRTLYAAADIFVSASRSEGMPFAVAEALCSCVAVVASELPGHRAVAGGVAACRIGPSDPKRMADDVRTLLARPADVVAREAQLARQSVVERLDLTSWAERLADLQASAANRR